jgi:NADH:ubiquinone oxidoreductase subunit 6 (subunit J)
VQKSTVGGILSIVAGALGLVSGLIILMVTLFMSSAFNNPAIFGDFATTDGQFLTIFSVIYGVAGVFCLIVGVLGIVGGIFSLQRKRWGWALAGAIAGCLSFLPLGVGAVVLVAMGKSEFNQNASGASPQPLVNNPA